MTPQLSPRLATRLAVHVCHDLAASAPKTFNAMHNWLTQCGFWLAELSTCPRTPDQVTFMIGLLAMALVREHTDLTLPHAAQCLKEHMVLHQLAKEAL